MIPSQQAMMLDAAMAFEHIIKNPTVGVKNPDSKVCKKIILRKIISLMIVGASSDHLGQSSAVGGVYRKAPICCR